MKPLPWSFSHLNNHQNCPHKFAEVTIHKRVSDDHSANEWGSWVHKQIELNLGRAQQPWHANMLPYVPHIDRAVAWAGEGLRYVELKMGLSRKLEAVNFFDVDVWGRAAGDLLVMNPENAVAHIIDWKAGKMKPDLRQLKLLAIFAFYHFPRITRVEASLEWLQYGTNTRETFHLIDLHDLWREFMPQLTYLRQAYATENFPKNPSGLCGWCPVESCEYWKPRR